MPRQMPKFDLFGLWDKIANWQEYLRVRGKSSFAPDELGIRRLK